MKPFSKRNKTKRKQSRRYRDSRDALQDLVPFWWQQDHPRQFTCLWSLLLILWYSYLSYSLHFRYRATLYYFLPAQNHTLLAQIVAGTKIVAQKYCATSRLLVPVTFSFLILRDNKFWVIFGLIMQAWVFFRKFLISGNLCSETSRILQFSCSLLTISDNLRNF